MATTKAVYHIVLFKFAVDSNGKASTLRILLSVTSSFVIQSNTPFANAYKLTTSFLQMDSKATAALEAGAKRMKEKIPV
jgi:hypothetical protein